MDSTVPSRRGRLLILAAVFVCVWVVRWVTLAGLGGDDHWSLWNAAAFLQGDTWFDGFVDMGDPLYWFMSAIAQWVVGYRVIGEVLLAITLVAVAITLSFDMAWEASRSWLLAVAIGLFVLGLASVTEVYSHPKIFVYPLGAWLSWRYIDKPTRLRALWLALAVAVAFGYRHDHGFYVGVGSMVAVIAAHWGEGRRVILLSAGRLALTGAVVLSPFFVLVQAKEGVVSYFVERIEFARQLDEAGRRAVPWVVDESRPSFWLGAMPPAQARVAVAWTPDVTPRQRGQLEERYTLSGGVDPGTGSRAYRLIDTSDTNVWALMSEPRSNLVDGVYGSFRQAWTMKDGPDGEWLTLMWVDSVGDEERRRLEEQYGLVLAEGEPGPGAVLTYDVRDRSTENITAIMRERLVVPDAVVGTWPVIQPVVARLREPPEVGPRVAVRWRDGVTASERIDLERQYQLVNPVQDTDDPNWFGYHVVDYSDANITALVLDDRVDDTGRLGGGAVEGTFVVRDDIPLPGSPLRVTWAPDVTDDERLMLEARYQLVAANRSAGMWEYALTDTSETNIRALLGDSRVAETSGIDVERRRPEGESWWASLGRDVPAFRVALLPRLVHAQNAGVWLYYVVSGLPWLVLALIGWDRMRGHARTGMAREIPKMVTLAVMMAVTHYALMRKLGVVADHANVAMVFGAWWLGRVFPGSSDGPGPSRPWRTRAAAVAAVGVLAVSAAAIWTYAGIPTVFASTGLSSGVETAWARSVAKFSAWSASPPIDGYAPVDATGDRALLRYFYACTTPEDRLWVTSDMYTTPYYAQRKIVRHIFWGNGFQNSPEIQRKTLELLEREPVPLIIGVGGARPLQYLEDYDILHSYASERYTEVHAVLQDSLNREGTVIWLSVDNRRTPTRTYEPLGLPCFA
jgi:hypothetical protein